MHRNLESNLLAWKQGPIHRPLVLRGARQVGKTFLLKKLARDHFSSFVYLDFEHEPKQKKIFDGSLNPDKILPQIEALFSRKITDNDTLLVLDEIQACPNALKSLRLFAEQRPDLHLAAAGSLLELAMAEISFPVGSVHYEWLYPLSFEEFLAASGKSDLSVFQPDIDTTEPVPAAVHDALLDMMRSYFVVGGMPAAVESYLQTRSFSGATTIQSDIWQSYIDDIHKYRGRMDVDGLDILLDSIPATVGSQVHYQTIAPEWRIDKTKKVLSLLEKLLLVHRVRHSPAHGLPLGAMASEKTFKLVMLDIGLMQHRCGLTAEVAAGNADLLGIYRGALAEQFVGQQMQTAGGSENRKLYYWARAAHTSSAEVDYVISRGSTIVPIEVKSGPSGRLRSADIFLKEHPDSPYALILSTGAIRDDESHRFRYRPLYTRLS